MGSSILRVGIAHIVAMISQRLVGGLLRVVKNIVVTLLLSVIAHRLRCWGLKVRISHLRTLKTHGVFSKYWTLQGIITLLVLTFFIQEFICHAWWRNWILSWLQLLMLISTCHKLIADLALFQKIFVIETTITHYWWLTWLGDIQFFNFTLLLLSLSDNSIYLSNSLIIFLFLLSTHHHTTTHWWFFLRWWWRCLISIFFS